MKQLGDLYSEPTPPNRASEEHTSEEGGALNLVDTAEFESSLAVDRMITSGEDKYHVPLEALVIRYATLVDVDPNQVRLPIHIRPLARAFQRTITAQNYPSPVLLKIFDYFTRGFMQGLQSYYLNLNETLITHGLRPDLEREITAKGTLLNQGRPPRPVTRKPPPTRNGSERCPWVDCH